MSDTKTVGELVVEAIKPSKKKKALKLEVIEFNISFRQMVNLMVKAALAAIPVLILLSVIYGLFASMGLGFLLRH